MSFMFLQNNPGYTFLNPLQSAYLFRRQTGRDGAAIIKVGASYQSGDKSCRSASWEIISGGRKAPSFKWTEGVLIQDRRRDKRCWLDPAWGVWTIASLRYSTDFLKSMALPTMSAESLSTGLRQDEAPASTTSILLVFNNRLLLFISDKMSSVWMPDWTIRHSSGGALCQSSVSSAYLLKLRSWSQITPGRGWEYSEREKQVTEQNIGVLHTQRKGLGTDTMPPTVPNCLRLQTKDANHWKAAPQIPIKFKSIHVYVHIGSPILVQSCGLL